jgi:type II secretory pathway component PulF
MASTYFGIRMSSFRYQALDPNGTLVDGQIEADDVQQAVARLAEDGLKVQSIRVAPGWEPDQVRQLGGSPPRDAAAAGRSPGESIEQAVLRGHLATILERGQLILPALEAFAEEMPSGRHRRQLRIVCQVLAKGDVAEAAATLSDLPELWIPLLSAASTSADPGRVLHEFLSESRRMDELNQQWGLTLIYPVLLLCLAITVLVALSVFVIPEFRAIFDDFDMRLPALTSLVLSMAWLLSGWGGVIIAVLLAVALVILLNANRLLPSSPFAWMGARFGVPFGRRTSVARFASYLADLLEAGVTLPNSLRIAGFSTKRSQLQFAAWSLANQLESDGDYANRDYSRPMTETLWHALTAEMPTAARIELLRTIATCHTERVRIGLSWTSGVVEPIAICLVGLSVAVVVLALFLPLVSLVKGLSG